MAWLAGAVLAAAASPGATASAGAVGTPARAATGDRGRVLTVIMVPAPETSAATTSGETARIELPRSRGGPRAEAAARSDRDARSEQAPPATGTACGARTPKPWKPSSDALFLAVPLLAALLLGRRIARRYRRLRCPRCQARMRRLERIEAFAELEAGQRVEELVGEVKYEVWRCPACQAIEKRGTRRPVPAQPLSLGAPRGAAAFLLRGNRGGLASGSGAVRPGSMSPASNRSGARQAGPGRQPPEP